MTLLAGTGVLILYQASMRFFFRPGAPAVSFWAFAVMIVSVVVDFLRTRTLRKAAADYSSSALASDAEHFANLVVTLEKTFTEVTSLAKSHEQMARLERALHASLPEVVRIHINPEVAS